MNSSLAIVSAIRPENEMETALAVQMAINHHLTSEILGRARHTDSVERIQVYGNLAVKLQRTFTAQIEALARLRGKGQQTVRVEHVTVQPGGQAIVGNVHHHPGGPGSSQLSGGQPHAQSQFTPDAPLAALPSPDEAGNGVPLPFDAKRKVPIARGEKHRGAEGEQERPQARSLHP